MSHITVFEAKRIVTLDDTCPSASHVAVRDGRILAIGGPDCADPWGSVQHDTRLADTILTPGFVEGHAHMMAGSIWRFAYAGYHDRIDPDGVLWHGRTTIEAVISGLRDHLSVLPHQEPLVAWGFDPIFLPTERLNRSHLDAICTDRPIAVLFSNFHLMCVNSAALAMVGYDADTPLDGVVKGHDGLPTGELQEMAAMYPILRRLGVDFRALSQSASAIRSYAKVAQRAGVTTITDLYSSLTDEDLDVMLDVTGDPDFPLRIVPAIGAAGSPADIADRALALRTRSTDKLRLGAVKLMTDGSIQGWTARVLWPGYVEGQPNGLWNTSPAEIRALAMEMQARGVQMHIHVNGDEAAQVSIEAISEAAKTHPWRDARHVLQHCQMMTPAMFNRCAELGICTNVFANHIWYFGDQHVSRTLGPDRAARMDDCRSALDAGVTLAIHSDAPVTPLGPLFTAWAAVNRQTMSGRVLGPNQCITVPEALTAITLGAARTLHLDHEIGSISVGKRADFAILGQDPTKVAPKALRDVPVLGTVSGGRVHLL